jgi:hypothetical protein
MSNITTLRHALGTLANAERGHAVMIDAAQVALRDIEQSIRALETRRDLDAQAERERMAQRLGRSR